MMKYTRWELRGSLILPELNAREHDIILSNTDGIDHYFIAKVYVTK
jgi:hypothetical protein